MRKIVSTLLVSFFLGVFALPLFAAVDDCDMPCCTVTVPCCEKDQSRPECPTLVQGRDLSPLLLPVAPKPVTTKLSYFLVLSSCDLYGFDSENSPGRQSADLQDFSVSYSRIPHYLLIHAYLI